MPCIPIIDYDALQRLEAWNTLGSQMEYDPDGWIIRNADTRSGIPKNERKYYIALDALAVVGVTQSHGLRVATGMALSRRIGQTHVLYVCVSGSIESPQRHKNYYEAIVRNLRNFESEMIRLSTTTSNVKRHASFVQYLRWSKRETWDPPDLESIKQSYNAKCLKTLIYRACEPKIRHSLEKQRNSIQSALNALENDLEWDDTVNTEQEEEEEEEVVKFKIPRRVDFGEPIWWAEVRFVLHAMRWIFEKGSNRGFDKSLVTLMDRLFDISTRIFNHETFLPGQSCFDFQFIYHVARQYNIPRIRKLIYKAIRVPKAVYDLLKVVEFHAKDRLLARDVKVEHYGPIYGIELSKPSHPINNFFAWYRIIREPSSSRMSRRRLKRTLRKILADPHRNLEPNREIHVECLVLIKLDEEYHKSGKHVQIFRYIGCSKLSCWACWEFMNGYSSDWSIKGTKLEGIATYGCGKKWEKWGIPRARISELSVSGFHPELARRVLSYTIGQLRNDWQEFMI